MQSLGGTATPDCAQLPDAGNKFQRGFSISSLRKSRRLMIFVCLSLACLAFGDIVLTEANDSETSPGTAQVKKVSEKKASEKTTNDMKSTSSAKSHANKKKSEDTTEAGESKRPAKIVKTNAEWKKILKPEQFRVARLKETEQPFTNKYWNNKKSGKYVCVCCGEELYSSEEKFDSGTGWPSFWAPISETAIGTETDRTLDEVRTEVHCDRCGAHLGHIFDDGPHPTGMRHCINSASLKFVPSETAKAK